MHSTDLYVTLNICFILHHSNILHFAFIFSVPFFFPHTNVCIMRRSKIKSKHSFFFRHSPSLWFLVEINSAKVILIFDIEFLKLVLVFLEIWLYGVFLDTCFLLGPVWKIVNTWPKKFLCYPLSKIGVFDFLISWIFRKKKRNKKKLIFGQFLLFLFRLPC